MSLAYKYQNIREIVMKIGVNRSKNSESAIHRIGLVSKYDVQNKKYDETFASTLY